VHRPSAAIIFCKLFELAGGNDESSLLAFRLHVCQVRKGFVLEYLTWRLLGGSHDIPADFSTGYKDCDYNISLVDRSPVSFL
jgi:hypothetical protein